MRQERKEKIVGELEKNLGLVRELLGGKCCKNISAALTALEQDLLSAKCRVMEKGDPDFIYWNPKLETMCLQWEVNGTEHWIPDFNEILDLYGPGETQTARYR